MTIGCTGCGAPADSRFALCPFCRAPRSEDAARHAIPCPTCHAAVAGDQSRCPSCASWVVVRCAFCEGLSPHVAAACVACLEPFAGMPERFRQEEERLARMPAAAREAVRRARQMSAMARRPFDTHARRELGAPGGPIAGMLAAFGASVARGPLGNGPLANGPLANGEAVEVVEEEIVERTENGIKIVRKTVRKSTRT